MRSVEREATRGNLVGFAHPFGLFVADRSPRGRERPRQGRTGLSGRSQQGKNLLRGRVAPVGLYPVSGTAVDLSKACH